LRGGGGGGAVQKKKKKKLRQREPLSGADAATRDTVTKEKGALEQEKRGGIREGGGPRTEFS